MWTLDDPVRAWWRREYEVPFVEIWDGKSYKRSEMERKFPALAAWLALLQPSDADVIYFFLGQLMLGGTEGSSGVRALQDDPPAMCWYSSFFVRVLGGSTVASTDCSSSSAWPKDLLHLTTPLLAKWTNWALDGLLIRQEGGRGDAEEGGGEGAVGDPRLRPTHVAHDEVHFPPGTELRLNFGAPPFASRITVPRCIAPDRKAIDNYPYLAAATDDRHGRLLLYATQGPDPEPPVLDAFYLRPLGVHHGFAKVYFICDATTREASRLPDPDHPFYVAELQPVPASGTATLLLYRSDSDAWVDEELSYPPHDRPWGGNGVVSHQDRLWWVDLSYGLLTCDVVYGDDPPDLHYVPLPQDSELPADTPDLEKRRCVQIDDEPDGDPIVRMWTLVDEDAGTWGFDCGGRFKATWDDEAYKATKLPRQVPAVALIHPMGPGDVVYFFLHSRIFAVDVRARKLLECRFFEMLHPPMRYHSSRWVDILTIHHISVLFFNNRQYHLQPDELNLRYCRFVGVLTRWRHWWLGHFGKSATIGFSISSKGRGVKLREQWRTKQRYGVKQIQHVLEAVERHWARNENDGLWLVLVCVPHVVHGDYFEPRIDNMIKAAIPPRATRLIVHRSIAPRRKTIDDHPYVAGADSHEHLLLYATQGPQPEPLVLDGFYRGPLGVHHGFPKAYFICDALTHRSTRLPDPDDRPILHPGNAALVGVSREKFFVADLHPTVGADHSSQLLYSSVSQAWLECELNYPPHDRPWGANGTVVHQKKIWWVDLSYGLLAFDLGTSPPRAALHPAPGWLRAATRHGGPRWAPDTVSSKWPPHSPPREKLDAAAKDRRRRKKDGLKWVVLACVPHVVGGDYIEAGMDNVIKDAIAPRATRLVAYFICDTLTHKSTRLPDHDFPIFHPGNAGLVAITKDIFVVADLHPTVGADKATLLIYFSVPESWATHEVDYPPRDRPWGGNGVVVHQTIIWWVDLSYGLLACDIGTRRHNLRFVPLPPDCELPPGTADLDKCRCVGFRGGELRYVEIHERAYDGKPVVSMWTLVDQNAGIWRLNCQALVKDIWNDEGYKATKLPREIPTVAFIHPELPGDVAYFLMRSRLFGVDLNTRKVLEWKFFAMLNPPMRYHSSRFVRPWSCPNSGSDNQKKDVPLVSTSDSRKIFREISLTEPSIIDTEEPIKIQHFINHQFTIT
uniref:DUF1618 domain-containing protein n=1 Tax=Oryza punctata TaxID=4537 RepID=A0A0E0JGA5_ORYPU